MSILSALLNPVAYVVPKKHVHKVIDGIEVNGVDMIEFNDDGQIVDFKVMLRPMKGIQIVGQKMVEMLEALKSGQPS